MAELSKTTLPYNQTVYIYQDIRAYFFELSSNPKYHRSLYRYRLISNETFVQAIQSFDNQPINQDDRDEHILRVGFEAGSNLLSLFWKPVRSVQEKIDEIVQKEFMGNYVIGIQLRYEFLSSEDTKVFVDCAFKIENHLTSGSNYTKKKIKWFLTSDTSESFERFRQIFGNKVFFLKNSLGHVASNRNFYERAIMDVELLSKCDEIITTGGSTFGFVAAIKANKMPFYVNGQTDMEYCTKMRLSHPSFRSKHKFAVF